MHFDVLDCLRSQRKALPCRVSRGSLGIGGHWRQRARVGLENGPWSHGNVLMLAEAKVYPALNFEQKSGLLGNCLVAGVSEGLAVAKACTSIAMWSWRDKQWPFGRATTPLPGPSCFVHAALLTGSTQDSYKGATGTWQIHRFSIASINSQTMIFVSFPSPDLKFSR